MRRREGGINWIWYFASTREEAIEYFREVTGAEPYDSTIFPHRNEWAFRIHR